MPFLSYERVQAVPGGAQTAAALTIPSTCQRAQLQADTADIRYTCDNATNPTAAVGMLLVADEPPQWMEVEDLQRMRFISVGAVGGLSLHYR